MSCVYKIDVATQSATHSHLHIVYNKMSTERYSGNSLNKNLRFIQMAAEQHKLAITAHVIDTNHRYINGTIKRKGDKILNRDEGAYKLHSIYDSLVTTFKPPTTTSKVYKSTLSRGTSYQCDETDRLSVKRHEK